MKISINNLATFGLEVVSRDDLKNLVGGTTCPDPRDFVCANRKCIPFSFRCDTEDDCGDGSDEVGCN